jgi:hypothetical protein
MTDAPRTIFMARKLGASEYAPMPRGDTMSMGYTDGHRYHHDDVVRELLEALEEARDEIDRYIRAEYPFDHPVHERYRQRDFAANPARAALAKLDGGE